MEKSNNSDKIDVGSIARRNHETESLERFGHAVLIHVHDCGGEAELGFSPAIQHNLVWNIKKQCQQFSPLQEQLDGVKEKKM